MKTSTMFVLLSLGAANLSTAITLPAFAEGNTPTTNGAGIAQPRAMTLDRLTKPKEGQKMGADQCADDRENCIPVEEMLD
jgi:predicted lipoprotein with Yx(FWY)xxD motif